MIFQYQAVKAAQVKHKALLFFSAQRQPFIGVATEPAMQPHRPLRSGLQALGQH